MNREEYLKDLALLMSTPTGRKVMWQILSTANIMAQSYSGDAAATAFNEGRRAVGLQLWADLEAASFEKLLTMQREAMESTNDHREHSTPTADIQYRLGLTPGTDAADRDYLAAPGEDNAGRYTGDPALTLDQ